MKTGNAFLLLSSPIKANTASAPSCIALEATAGERRGSFDDIVN
jgi:hypothetical protein